MSVIFSKARHLIRARAMIKIRVPARGAVLLDKDWMPGPYPKNEKERKAAAKKYNLLPEEYEPLDPKWDAGMGDYPVLPNRCWDCEDPYGNYEYMADYRDFGQPVHHGYEVLHAQGMNLAFPDSPDYVRPANALLVTWTLILLVYWYWKFVTEVPFITTAKPLHRPGQGVAHYHYPTSNLHAYE